MFPQISLLGPLYNLWRQIGLYDTWPGLIIPYLTFALPLSIFVLSAFFREIPWELEQAAQIDGATPFQALRKVIAPLATPGIVTTVIIVFIICWNDFIFAISLTSTTSAETVPAAIAQFPGASQFTQPIGDIAAAAVVVTSERVSSRELEELAHDAGSADLPRQEGSQVVARLEAASQVRQGQEAELWFNSEHLHLFDPETGKSLLDPGLDGGGSAPAASPRRLNSGRRPGER
jgi:hypothetical protein